MTYDVKPIPKEITYDWLLNKHYAKRIPSVIRYCFGLYEGQKMQGVCVFGLGNRMFNDGYALFGEVLKVETVELVRLVVNDGLAKNVLSFFVANSLKKLPQPIVVYSYADSNHGHHGYIYQATNWLYTGITKPRTTFFDETKGEFIHERTLSGIYGTSARGSLPSHIKIGREDGGKHRYLFFVGNKRQVRDMNRALKYEVLPYPKGDNTRYDASYAASSQAMLL